MQSIVSRSPRGARIGSAWRQYTLIIRVTASEKGVGLRKPVQRGVTDIPLSQTFAADDSSGRYYDVPILLLYLAQAVKVYA